MRLLPASCLLALLFATGCRESTGGISSVSLESGAVERTPPIGQGASDGVNSSAAEITQIDAHAIGKLEEPVYPKALQGTHIGLVDIPIRVVVGKDGTVIDIVRLSVAQNVTVPHYAEFEAAIRKAVEKWRFSPARILSSKVDTDKGLEHVTEELVEMSFDYHFRFYESKTTK